MVVAAVPEAEGEDKSGPLNAARGVVARSSNAITSSQAAFGLLRHLVSGSKLRFQREGFDLDLTYILPSMIALGLPSTGVEQIYRNPISEVRQFMDKYHPRRYVVVNLCDEREYSDEEFPDAVVLRYPFADHHPPALLALYNFCVQAYQFLKKHTDNVMAVHCKAGKGRTGVMICRRVGDAHLARCRRARCSSPRMRALEWTCERAEITCSRVHPPWRAATCYTRSSRGAATPITPFDNSAPDGLLMATR